MTGIRPHARIDPVPGEEQESVQTDRQGFARRNAIWIALVAASAWALLLRLVHLAYPTHYYLVSPDSHFFHWLAARLMAGEGPPPDARLGATYSVHSGLAYPTAYIAKAIASAFSLSPAESLDLVCKFLPPVLGLVSLVIVYVAASRIWGRRAGFFSAFAWGLMLPALFLGAAGMIDRDGLSALLMLLGALAFYFSKGWQFRVRGRDLGWLVAGLAVLAIEVMLYLEWSVVGAILLLGFVVLYFVARCIMEYLYRLKTEPRVRHRAIAALNQANWQSCAVVVAGNALMAAVLPGQVGYWATYLAGLLRARGQIAVVELQGIGPTDLLIYYFFLIPLVIALVIAARDVWRRRIACWFVFFVLLSVFSRRILILATPPAAMLSGVGLAFIWGWAKNGPGRQLRRLGTAVLVVLLVLMSFVYSTSIGADRVGTVHEDWQDALRYLREETPEDAIIMTQWTWGYRILDMGLRRPFVDGGYYGYDLGRLHDVGTAYATSEPSEAARVMAKNGADYLVFSKSDSGSAPTILSWAGLSEYDSFPEDSLYARSTGGDFEADGGLEVVYRSEPDSEVVVLARNQGGQP